MKLKDIYAKRLLWFALLVPLIGLGCVSTDYVDKETLLKLEERIDRENAATAAALVAEIKGMESAVIKQVVTALTNALDAKKIALRAQESAEVANTKAADALDDAVEVRTYLDKFSTDVAEIKKIAVYALENTTKVEAATAVEELRTATEAITVAIKALERRASETKPAAPGTLISNAGGGEILSVAHETASN